MPAPAAVLNSRTHASGHVIIGISGQLPQSRPTIAGTDNDKINEPLQEVNTLVK